MGIGKALENQGFRAALRLGRRKILVRLDGGKKIYEVWSNYRLSRDVKAPVQRTPKVGHFSTPKAVRE